MFRNAAALELCRNLAHHDTFNLKLSFVRHRGSKRKQSPGSGIQCVCSCGRYPCIHEREGEAGQFHFLKTKHGFVYRQSFSLWYLEVTPQILFRYGCQGYDGKRWIYSWVISVSVFRIYEFLLGIYILAWLGAHRITVSRRGVLVSPALCCPFVAEEPECGIPNVKSPHRGTERCEGALFLLHFACQD